MAKDTWAAVKKQFPKGAKVQLNVGGPKMAVKGYVDEEEENFADFGKPRRNGQIICQWFSGKKLEQGGFAPETLVVAKDDTEEESS